MVYEDKTSCSIYMEVWGVVDESVWNLKMCATPRGVVYGTLKCGVWVR